MTAVAFYHLTRFALEDALPKLLAKAHQAGHKILVRASTADQIEALDRLLWVFDADAFLPHGSGSEFAADQPIYLSAGEDVPNAAGILVLVDGRAPDKDLEHFERCLILFNGNDDQQTAQARTWWKDLKDKDHDLTYWQQTERGGWEKKGTS